MVEAKVSNLRLLLKLIVLVGPNQGARTRKFKLEDGSSILPRGSMEILIKINENLDRNQRRIFLYKTVKNEALSKASKVTLSMPDEDWVFIDVSRPKQ